MEETRWLKRGSLVFWVSGDARGPSVGLGWGRITMMIQGVIHGKIIELENAPGIPDGQTVSVEIRPIVTTAPRDEPAPVPWWLERLDVDPAVKPGKFVVKGTRLLADALIEELEAGRSEQELLQLHPELTPADVAAVRGYATVPLPMRRLFGAWAEDAEELDLAARLLDAEPQEVPVIRDALAPDKDQLLEQLWTAVERPAQAKEQQRLRAACALATYDPDSQRWAKVREQVADDLVGVPAVHLATWMESLRPVRGQLQAPLAAIYRDAKRRETERSLATDILADYAADQPQVLADLVMDADDKQFAVIYPKFKEQGERGLPALTSEIDKTLPPDLPSSDEKREKLAKRQANAAVALLRMKQPAKVWPLLKHSPDPRVRSYLIHRLYPLGADAGTIIQRLDEEPDVTIRRALILSLGEYGEKELSPEARKAMLPKLQDMYRTDSDPGLHAAAEWLLRQWQQQAWLKEVNNGWAKDKEQREKRLECIQR